MAGVSQRVVIVGGGTSGWMTAAALSRMLPAEVAVQLVESEQIGTVGVGEATIPHIRYFNALLGIDEREFIQATQATYKLAIEFVGWGAEHSCYMHPFSGFGGDIHGIGFHHYWLKLREQVPQLSLDAFSLAAQAARVGRFAPPSANSDFGYGYAFHLDASRYAAFLRRYAEQRGVRRIEGKVHSVQQHPHRGDITSVTLETGAMIAGDLFIDCSGFRSLLLGQTLGVPFQSWRHWLPCDRAIALPSDALTEPPSYTRATATPSGWQWRIPLQERTGNGQVYCSNWLSDDEACAQLRGTLNSEPLAEPNLIRFEAGCRHHSWEKNCIAIGLSSGFLEPLESTSIYLIQMAIFKLVEFFPRKDALNVSREAFNRWMALEYDRVRDFIILHYHLNRRQDSEFWRSCAAMEIPDSLTRKIALFRESARVEFYDQGLFAQPSWLAVYLGQGCHPLSIDARVDRLPVADVNLPLTQLALKLRELAAIMPTHREVLNRGGFIAGNPSMSLYGGRYG
jgi:tryptophan halogenase